MKRGKKVLIGIGIVLLILIIGGVYFMGNSWGMGPLGFLKENRMKALAGNQEEYHLENVEPLKDSPMKGMNLCFLGSSVTAGDASLGVAFPDYIAKRNDCTYVKEAVGGTTLVDDKDNSYISRMKKNINPDDKFDAFIFQLSTNDASQDKPLGSVSDSTNLEDFDTGTVVGAIEYIICYAQQTWDCPVIIYTGTKYDSYKYENYEKMVAILPEIQEKWGIGVIDLWNNEEMDAVSEEDYELYMADGVHPTQAGYLEWWTPAMEEYLYEYLKPQE